MTKRLEQGEKQGPGGWGETQTLTARQQAEIETCINCSLPECVYMDRELEFTLCPIERAKEAQRWAAAKRRNRRDVEDLIAAWWRSTGHVS